MPPDAVQQGFGRGNDWPHLPDFIGGGILQRYARYAQCPLSIVYKERSEKSTGILRNGHYVQSQNGLEDDESRCVLSLADTMLFTHNAHSAQYVGREVRIQQFYVRGAFYV